MGKKITVQDFSQHLFWDVDLKTFDLEVHKIFMVGRVLEYGLIQDWKNLKKLYGLQQIKEISLNLRSLDAVTLSFVSTIFNINKTEFRCYKHRQLVQNYWNS
ncbi:hypothetical protein SAMN05421847_0104 [Halpernia humi]|uniref:DUF6922 domain-containing protein n=1 Tax=Halpernia humi TaxID=493375 RepID=A0A1H5SCR2_9FLAO|nr:hypothetical protein [Halpernia humi]SEF48220.1 hypothetical protein SAMN05421847_0104 [Halpernia humi]